MTQRTKAAMDLSLYFEKHGRILTPREYKEQTDVPIRFAAVQKVFGSWNRMENIVRKFNIRNEQRSEQPVHNDVDEILRRQVEAAAEYEAKMRAASEDVDAKTAREEAARAYIEADKLAAATAEGAYENKMRKGGVTSQDAKAKKEAIEQAVAEEHAMLAKTPEGSALGKHLLGGVEDNDEKTRVIAEQNAMREKTKLMAATPLGAAEAKLMEDDTDGQLTREAQARVRNELRTYVPPVADGNVEKAKSEGIKKVRDEVRQVVESAASDENVMMSSVFKASAARSAARVNDLVGADDVPDEVLSTMAPASQIPDESVLADDTSFEDKDGNKTHVVEDAPQPGTKEMTSEASENEKNPEATPADRNPDPKLATPGTGDAKQGNTETATTDSKTQAAKTAPKPAAKK